MSFNYDKLRDTIHYVCDLNTAADGNLDDIKLNKVLWYADAMAYMQRGQPITGATYIRKQHGPVARYNSKAVKELLDDGFITEGRKSDDGIWRRVLDSTAPVKKSVFSESDRSIIEQVYEHLSKNTSSMEVSEQSHGDIWLLARDKEEIPLYTMFAENARRPNAEEMEEASAAA